MNKTKQQFIYGFIILIVIGLLIYGFLNYNEQFSYLMPYKNRVCGNCESLDQLNCGKCVNCGYCVKSDGTAKCVSGDDNGPYYETDCESYYPNSNGVLQPESPTIVNYTYYNPNTYWWLPYGPYWNNWYGRNYWTNWNYWNNRYDKRYERRDYRRDYRKDKRHDNKTSFRGSTGRYGTKANTRTNTRTNTRNNTRGGTRNGGRRR